MRPRKRILLVDANEECRGELAFVLNVSGYRVLDNSGPCELIVVRNVTMESCKYIKDRCQCLVLQIGDDSNRYADASVADNSERSELLARIRVMSARKRGPRKGTIYAARA